MFTPYFQFDSYFFRWVQSTNQKRFVFFGFFSRGSALIFWQSLTDFWIDSPLDLESWKLKSSKETSEHLRLIPWVISTNYIPPKTSGSKPKIAGLWIDVSPFTRQFLLGLGHNKIQTPPPPDTGRSIKSLEGQKIYDIYYWEEVQLGRGRAFGYSIDTSSNKFLKPRDSLNQTYVVIKIVRARTPTSCCLKLQ